MKPNLSLKVDITSESGVSMKELDFALRFFVYGNPEDVNIHKSQLYQHEGKYYALLNEESFAKGWLFCDVIIAEYASGNPNVSYVTVRCNTGCLVNDCCREAEDLTTSGQGYVVKFSKEEVYPYPGYSPEYLTSEELWTSYFRLPELTADRAIADEHGNRITDTYVRREAVANHIKQIYNQQFLDNPPLITEGYITPEMLSEETKQMLESTGQTINNLPDGEDLQSVHGVLKLADKQYNPNSYSGLGRRILRKNIVAGVNVLTQSMMQWPNTIYIIQYDYDLQGETITVPENCVLQFEGGMLSNGTIVGDKTKISSNGANIFNADNISFDGTYLNNIFNLSWFYSIEDESAIHKAIAVIPLNKTLLCDQEEIYLKKELTVNRGIDLDFSKTKIYLENDASITFNKVSKRRFKFDTITGNGLNTIGLNLKSCSFCTFDFQEITDCLYGIVFNFDGVNGKSIGQNIFRYVLIYRCNIGIYFKGANEWSNDVVWAEGNEFFGGFIAKCYNSGIKLEDNIKCGNSIFVGAVDCIEAGENAYDIIDETNETSYAQKNIYISNFIRVAKCKFRKRDLILSTEYGIQSHATIKSHDGIQTANSNGSVILSGGTMEMYNPSGPYIDLKRIDTDDREWRISGGDKYVVSPKDTHGFELDKDNEFSVPIKGRYEVAAGETTATIPFPSIKPSSDYILIITPYFNTNYYVQNKSQNGAVVKFSTAPTEDSYIEYVVFGL